MPNNMHNLNFDATSNIQHTYFHTSATEQVHRPMNNYQGQTNIVSSANLYETSCANDFNTFSGRCFICLFIGNKFRIVDSKHADE